ncbi:hypothetical protein BXZ70DRAFT_1061388 [Cristinia sonorae]|uniref:BRCT domain-containing protein n=1 Tax=Cristinia sonorae TaxID=1940300 RepID=A0A8K0XTW2_9AGAR|nr:hypothetical protein BXZ70DRAFT_1061388 [Cristinia sonorae]
MDKFVTVIKPSTQRAETTGKATKDPQKPSALYAPYDATKKDTRKPNNWRDRQKTEKLIAPLLKNNAEPSAAAITKHLLSTLSDESNPITHSEIYTRTDYVTSAATGHQRGEGRGPEGQEYFKARGEKLKAQHSQGSSVEVGVLKNVRAYIDGYLDNTTDLEMKRIVTVAGGSICLTSSGATHILTSQQLSGSKTQKWLTTKPKAKVHVVRPEWVSDCIKAGKRLPERNYAVIKGSTMLAAFVSGSSSQQATE